MYTLIFSKDRPAQLDLLLQSMALYVKSWQDLLLLVMWRATTDEARAGYNLLFKTYWDIWEREDTGSDDFRKSFTELVSTYPEEYMQLLVDDCLIIRNVPLASDGVWFVLSDAMKAPAGSVFSLRLGKNVTTCYSENGRAVKQPPDIKWDKQISWNVARHQSAGDWSYPASLDGTIFRTRDLAKCIAGKKFNNPNTLETLLAASWPKTAVMHAHANPSVIGIAHNSVQDAGYKNRCGSGSADELIRMFLDGKRLRTDCVLKGLLAAKPNACHIELPLERFML